MNFSQFNHEEHGGHEKFQKVIRVMTHTFWVKDYHVKPYANSLILLRVLRDLRVEMLFLGL